jgi:hypothetical protein
VTLNLESFGDRSDKKSKSKYKAALGVGSAVSLFGIGSTLAANITLSGDNTVEFGQGVVQTAACDEDGFSITPLTKYDNYNSIFRVTHLQITGIDLTPEGSGWAVATDPTYVNQDAAKLAHPGQYYDGANWKKTCDNVALDFHAYTTDPLYAKYTTAGFFNVNTTDTSAPLMWSQKFDGDGNLDGTGSASLNIPGIAAAIDAGDVSGSDSNYGWDYYSLANGAWWGDNDNFDITNLILSDTNSSFKIRLGDDPNGYTYDGNWYYDDNYQPNAAAISKITVQSMKYFPDNYYADNGSGPGVNPN